MSVNPCFLKVIEVDATCFNHFFNEFIKLVEFVRIPSIQTSILIEIVSSKHDHDIGDGEQGHGVAELVKVQGAVVVDVDNVPVLDAELVEDLLRRVRNADEVRGLLGALGQLVARDRIVPVAVAKFPQWLKPVLADLENFNFQLI